MIRRAFAVALLGLVAAARGQDETAGQVISGLGAITDAAKPAQASKLKLAGIRAFTEEEVRAAVSQHVAELDEKGVSPTRADDVAYYVGAFYRKAGFARVETTFRITGDSVLVTVQEGPRTLLRGLRFTGNKAFTEEQLYQYMIGGTPEQLQKEPDLYAYNEGAMNAGAERVHAYYVSEGYLDVKVDATDAKISAGGTRADVRVNIDEGVQYTFGGLSVTGEPIFSIPKLLVAMRERPDGPFSRTKVIAMQRNLESFYRNNGYVLIKIEVTADPLKANLVSHPKIGRRAEVPITFHINPGPQHRFDGVTVNNQTSPKPRLRSSFIPLRFAHLSGEIYSPEKVDETYRELLRTGLFENLRMTPTPLPDITVRLDFEAEEAKAREVGFTIGFGTYDGFKIGTRLADRNFLGNGRPLSLAADWTQRGLVAELLYVEPWFLEKHYLNARAKIYSADRQEEGYAKREAGFRGDLNWKILPRLEVGGFIQGTNTKITEHTIDPLLLGPLDYTFISLGLQQTLDYRDNEVSPKRGWIFSTAVDLGTIDNEQAFTREVARFSWYIPIGKSQLSLGSRVGAIQPIAPSIPIDLRFFNGGATTVRSFSERQLGPKDKSGNPLGGEFFSVQNIEFTFPIREGFLGAIFFDAGNLTGWEDFGLGDMRYAIGVGIRYALPVGPLRIDYGINPDRREDEDFGALHVSFGAAF